MFWNLFERIINAVRPTKQSEQQSADSQSWPESSTEHPAAPQEQPSDTEQMAHSPQQTDWNSSDSQQRDY